MKMPVTFIQIHYHNQPGGVRRVIASYARAFGELTGAEESRNVVVWACRTAQSVIAGVKQVHLPECDYRGFRTTASFLRVRDRIITSLGRTIREARCRGSVCVAGHNLTLGKNPALVSAIAQVARDCVDDPEIRFISVIHDTVEQGRIGLMRGLDRLASTGVPIWDHLYPRLKNMSFISINPLVHKVLRECGIPSRHVPNPIQAPRRLPALSRDNRLLLTEGLRRLAGSDGTEFYPERRTIFLPGRIVARKGIAEAVLVACLLLKANLLTGGCGASEKDRQLMLRLRRICRNARIPAVFDVERIALPAGFAGKDVFDIFYRFCDVCISCSVDEGFGYGLHEPWLFGVPVIGRKPLSCARSPVPGLLYSSIPIPVHLVPLRRIVDKYKRCLLLMHHEPFHRLDRWLVGSEGVDFGALDLRGQLEILSQVADKLGQIHCRPVPTDIYCRQRRMLHDPKGDPEETSRILHEMKKKILLSGAWDRFLTRFRTAVTRPVLIARPGATRNLGGIRKRLGQPRYFRLVLGSE